MKAALIALLLVAGCSKPDPAQAQYEQKFQESMKNVTLVGHSTRWNKEGIFGPEKYRIDSISKVAGDNWLFQTRLQYDGREIPVPIPLNVKWAGDTPVITLTNLTIPGVGTWTARVLIYGDQYAGTWSGENHGGQMFGKVVKGN